MRPDGNQPAERPRGDPRNCLTREPLLTATIIGVVAGVAGGCGLHYLEPSDNLLEAVGFPGEILMRMLRMVVLPLIAGSMIAGVCSLRESTFGMGKVARITLLYYFLTTFTAVLLGLLVVIIIRPGRWHPFQGNEDKSTDTDLDKKKKQNVLSAIFGVLRDLFPSNGVAAAADMNILGVITISILFGLGLTGQGTHADSFVHLIKVFNATIEKIVIWILYYAPFGIFSLIMHNVAKAKDLTMIVTSMGLFVATVVLGLLIQAFVVIPLAYFLFTRKFPWKVYSGFTAAFITAFGTDSSSATLPVTMRCAADQGAHEDIIQFVLPLGATVNMNGTALYEAVAVLFIAQANDYDLSIVDTIIVALVATLAAVGAAGIPEAGLVTMVLVLNAVNMGQFISDIGIIFTIDWFLDRCRTTVNVLGDAVGCMAVEEIVYKGKPENYEPVIDDADIMDPLADQGSSL